MKSSNFDDYDDGAEQVKKKKKELSNEKGEFGEFSKDFHPLLRYDAINRYFILKRVLIEQGIEVPQYNMYCPFHDDEATGKPSARYHEDTDELYCFSERKSYTAYHALKLLCEYNMDEVFYFAWDNLSVNDKEELLRKYDGVASKDKIDTSDKIFTNPIFEEHKKNVLGLFKDGGIPFSTYKNELYITFKEMYEEELISKGILKRKGGDEDDE